MTAKSVCTCCGYRRSQTNSYCSVRPWSRNCNTTVMSELVPALLGEHLSAWGWLLQTPCHTYKRQWNTPFHNCNRRAEKTCYLFVLLECACSMQMEPRSEPRPVDVQFREEWCNPPMPKRSFRYPQQSAFPIRRRDAHWTTHLEGGYVDRREQVAVRVLLTDSPSCFWGSSDTSFSPEQSSQNDSVFLCQHVQVWNTVSGYLESYLSPRTGFFRQGFCPCEIWSLRDGQQSKALGHCAPEDDPQGMGLGLLCNATPNTSPTVQFNSFEHNFCEKKEQRGSKSGGKGH